ncbi:Uncharacterised protein [Vibrio cholerae]|nr:Uncharacterised protein [Vibrio cholerae]
MSLVAQWWLNSINVISTHCFYSGKALRVS